MRLTLGLCLLGTGAFLPVFTTVGTGSAPREEIEGFNKHYLELHQKMDTAGVLALWAEDGVNLMPDEAPIVGKKAIVAWLDGVQKGIAGYKVTKEELEFHDIQVAGDWASEWATEHQVVQEPDGKSAIETYGKIALVLHREPHGEWRVQQEMWNASPKS